MLKLPLEEYIYPRNDNSIHMLSSSQQTLCFSVGIEKKSRQQVCPTFCLCDQLHSEPLFEKCPMVFVFSPLGFVSLRFKLKKSLHSFGITIQTEFSHKQKLFLHTNERANFIKKQTKQKQFNSVQFT